MRQLSGSTPCTALRRVLLLARVRAPPADPRVEGRASASFLAFKGCFYPTEGNAQTRVRSCAQFPDQNHAGRRRAPAIPAPFRFPLSVWKWKIPSGQQKDVSHESSNRLESARGELVPLPATRVCVPVIVSKPSNSVSETHYTDVRPRSTPPPLQYPHHQLRSSPGTHAGTSTLVVHTYPHKVSCQSEASLP